MENDLTLTDLIDLDTLQKIQDAFANMTGMASCTTDANGVTLTRGSNFTEFCEEITRKSPIGNIRCQQCDRMGRIGSARGGIKEASQPHAYVCHAGLVDFSAPIIAGDKIVGIFIGGQVLVAPPDLNKTRKIAAEIGVDPERYVAAIKKVRISSKENVEKATRFLYTIANILSDMAYHKYLVYQMNKEVEKATQLKSDFLANMSHEIRTPMNAVVGMAEMALREDLSPTARDYINQIKFSSKTLLTIINDILDISKIESGKMKIIPVAYDPMSIINDVSNILMTRIGDKNVELLLDISPNLPCELYGDNLRIKQIMINLGVNAIKFTQQGKVTIRVSFTPIDEHTIDLRVSIEDTGIGIKEDHMDQLFHAFQQLDSKRNRNIEGTGLGLAISKQLLTLMNGNISVESEYEKGSKFSFHLPQNVIHAKKCITIQDTQPRCAAILVANSFVQAQLCTDLQRFGISLIRLTSPNELPVLLEKTIDFLFVEHCLFTQETKDFIQNHPSMTAVLMTSFLTTFKNDMANLIVVKKPLYSLNIAAILNHEDTISTENTTDAFTIDFTAPDAKILIVDDNAINLTVAKGLLKPLEMQIDTALSGKEAIRKISSTHYDLIFMDHMMPEVDGVETTHIIRRFYENYKNVPIIALTANAVDGTKEMFIREGMDDMIPKPIEMRLLIKKLKLFLPEDKILHTQQKTIAPNAQDVSATAQAETSAPLNIAGLNTDAALQMLGNRDLFFEVLNNYYAVIDEKCALIQNYATHNDLKNYTIEVHALKSASKQIGAMKLSSDAARLEAAGNAGNVDLIKECTPALLADYQKYRTILAPYCEEKQMLNHAQKDYDVKEISCLFDKMEQALDELDIDQMEQVVQEMNVYHYSDEQQIWFSQLQHAVEAIDIDACEDILTQWRTHL